MKMNVALIITAVVLSGCNAQLEDYVRDAIVKPVIEPTQSVPDAVSNSDKIIKISNGHVDASSATLSVRATIGPSNQRMAGATKSAQIAIQRGRVD